MRDVMVALLVHCACISISVAQSGETRHGQLDVAHYTFNIALTDASDSIKAQALITIRFLQQSTAFQLDLTGKQTTGKGMTVLSVKQDGSAIPFEQQNDKITITAAANAGDSKTYTVQYAGIPADGLIITKNKYGHRTIFADNWPNRAHQWLPCIDHPSDKASVDFIVTAPAHYQVISNGLQEEETSLGNNLKRTHWHEPVALPTKVMVIGLADFAVNYAGSVDCIPVYSWVYPEERDKGFYDYALAKNILPWFIKNIGPYPYQKLANVQSKTMFGGMENASAIFYFENSIKGDRKIESLLAHEIAHQWFGNSATEKSWQHVWLSEGFATYLTHLYLEDTYGADTLVKRMQADRNQVVAFAKKKTAPVVDTTVNSNFLQLLNANSYQKGGWVLHMLRHMLGDSVFRKGIRNYYAAYGGKNADTDDFRTIMEAASGQSLQRFFQQWLFTPGQPDLAVSWHYDGLEKTVVITIVQNQQPVFYFPLTIAVTGGNGQTTKTFSITQKSTTVKIPCHNQPNTLILDPGTHLLFTSTVAQVR